MFNPLNHSAEREERWLQSSPWLLFHPGRRCFLMQTPGQGAELYNTCIWTIKPVIVAQSCPTLCDPMDSSPPGSPVHGILQARILEWVAISFSSHSRIIQINQNVETTQMALQAIHRHIKCGISIQHNMIQLLKAIRYMDESWKKKHAKWKNSDTKGQSILTAYSLLVLRNRDRCKGSAC